MRYFLRHCRSLYDIRVVLSRTVDDRLWVDVENSIAGETMVKHTRLGHDLFFVLILVLAH